MNQQESAPISTETPAARNVGSIPITRSPSQDATPAGKPGKTWEVGAPYIINQADAPDWNHIVVCTHTDGRCRYLCIRHNRRWPHVMQLSERSTPLAAFGIVLWLSIGGIEGNQAHDSVAVYPDGKPRRWQAGKSNSMPLMPANPKYWRLDPQVAPKLIKWIQGNPAAVQQAKGNPLVSCTSKEGLGSHALPLSKQEMAQNLADGLPVEIPRLALGSWLDYLHSRCSTLDVKVRSDARIAQIEPVTVVLT